MNEEPGEEIMRYRREIRWTVYMLLALAKALTWKLRSFRGLFRVLEPQV